MARMVEIESTPALPRLAVESALARHGIPADLVANTRPADSGELLTFSVRETVADLSRRLHHALEDAISASGTPLLCTPVAGSYVIHPPAA